MKSIFQSKTFWVNLIVGILTMFNQEFLTSLGINGQAQMIVLVIINLILRLFTKTEVTVLPPAQTTKKQ